MSWIWAIQFSYPLSDASIPASIPASMKICLFNLPYTNLLNLNQNPMQKIMVNVEMGSQPKSPSRATTGAFLPTPIKLLIK